MEKLKDWSVSGFDPIIEVTFSESYTNCTYSEAVKQFTKDHPDVIVSRVWQKGVLEKLNLN